MIRRREFIALGAASVLGSGSGLAPAWAQQPAGRKRVALLHSAGNPDGSLPATTQAYVAAMRAGLKEEGFIDGVNLAFDIRLGLNDPGVTRAAAHDLAGGGYDVLVGNTTVPTAALLAETKTTPIVFVLVPDPVGSGFVQSFARPGGYVTGFTHFEPSLAGKWLDMLHQVAPGVRRAVMIFNPDASAAGFFVPAFRTAAAALGIEPVVAEVRSLAEVEAAIADIGKTPGNGVVMGVDTFLFANRRIFIDAVARQNLPAVYPFQECVEDGGLISYGVDFTDIYRRGGGYVGLVLKGARPADLPVQTPATFFRWVNLKTARAQGITIPPSLLVAADNVIE